MRRHLCLFAHFDRDDRVEPYVVRYVRAIADAGFDVVFISASNPDATQLAPLQSICSHIILRENCGHDFGSWSEGYRRFGQGQSGELLLANDSVYGPIGDLGQAVHRLRGLNADMAGFVESRAVTPHLQSWFLLVRPQAHSSAAFRHTLLQDFTSRSKRDIVMAGEIGLSVAMRAAGFKVAGLFSDVGLVFSEFPFNPAQLLWRELIENEHCPFLKIELVRDNPCRVPGLGAWRQVIARRAPELPALIEEHLTRPTGRPFVHVDPTLAGALMHYANWYRRAYRLRSAVYPLRKLNALVFDALTKVYKTAPQSFRVALGNRAN